MASDEETSTWKWAVAQGLINVVTLPLRLLIYFIPPRTVAKRTFPLFDAIRAEDMRQVGDLIAHGTDPNSRETQATGKWWFRQYAIDVPQEMAKTALMVAAGGGHYKIVEALLDAGADVRASAVGFGETALTWALGHDGRIEIAKLLVDRGADVNARGFEPPLTVAAASGRMDQVGLLLEYGADVNAVDDEGYTALIEAAGSGYEDVVVTLIAAGIDINARNKEGHTALHYAKEKRQAHIVELLVKAGAHG